jgi:hypothetical protein
MLFLTFLSSSPFSMTEGMLIFIIALVIFQIVCMMKLFEKAGKPGWAAIVPIYNFIVLLEIIGKPVWWFILVLIPIVNIIVLIMIWHQLSLSFGKDVLFTLGLIFLGFIFYPILAFGSAQYVGPGGVPSSR